MKIVVASNNPIKIKAARSAFSKMFPKETIEIINVSVSSNVSDQPMSAAETLQGAQNRARNAHKEIPDADFWVGQERGLVDTGDSLRSEPWMSILAKSGRESHEHATSFTIPKELECSIRNGMELSDAADKYFNELNTGKTGGVIKILTNGNIDRLSYYEQALITTLIPFI